MTFPNIEGVEIVADTETTGLKWWKGHAFCLTFCTSDGIGHYVDLKDCSQLQWARDNLPLASSVVFHNAKFDLHFMSQLGINIDPRRVNDTMIAAALINEHEHSYALDHLAKKYCGAGKTDNGLYEKLSELFGGRATKNVQMCNLHKAPRELIEPYAIGDVIIAQKLWNWQKAHDDWEDLAPVYAMEMELMPVIMDMEKRGVRVDIGASHKAAKELEVIINKQQQELNLMAGHPVNPNPSNSLTLAVVKGKNIDGQWEAKDGTVLDSTNGGKAQINAEALKSLKMPEAALILELRKLKKTRDTFIMGHILGHHDNGVVHANFNQIKSDNDAGTGTGRLSVNDPALQQIPKRDKKLAAIVRSLFIPDEGCKWLCLDYAQADYRVAVSYWKDKNLISEYKNNPNLDFHQRTASLTGLPRSAPSDGGPYAKMLGLGLIFSMGKGKMAEKLGLPFEEVTRSWGGEEHTYLEAGPEAQEIFKVFHKSVPRAAKLAKEAAGIAKSRGYIKSLMGRRIRFPHGHYTYKASGLLYQSGCAEMLKIKMIELYDMLKGTKSRLVFTNHDEFDISLHPDDEHMVPNIKKMLETFDGVFTPFKIRTPIVADVGIGPNWWEASK